ncbi:MAG: NUDIX hydrolase [Dehalococcoidia bacterium]
MAEPEITISTERVFQGRRINVRVDRVRLSDGTESSREIIEHPNAVVIVAVDDQRNVLFVRQYRKAPETELFELPAGVIDPGEDPPTAALRELREETGCSADRLEQIGYFYSAPGTMTEKLYAFLATGLKADPLPPDEDERIEVERVPLDRALEMARAGEINDAKSLASLLLAEPRIA